MSASPITRIQRYDFLGGCNGIDHEFSLPACTSSDLLHSSEFQRFAAKFRKGVSLHRYGREGGEIPVPFSDAEKDFARYLWNARRDVQDEYLVYASRKFRAEWTLGERLGVAMLLVQVRLPIVKTAAGHTRLPLGSLTYKQRGEWLMTLLEYEVHIRQKCQN